MSEVLATTVGLLKRRLGTLVTRIARRYRCLDSFGRSGFEENRSSTLSRGFDNATQWLEQNGSERMDATISIFDPKRREFHLDRYRFAANQVTDKRVLDCASGTGYGVRLLMEEGKADLGIGIEIDQTAIKYANRKHGVKGTRFICASGDHMPVPDACVEVITSFETIEHVPDDEALINEFHRVLQPEGLLFISTPNQWPVEVSPFHLREYDKDSFLNVLSRGFECVGLYNQNSGSQTPYNHNQVAGIVATTPENEHLAECYLAVCRRKP